ncbi:hypothetical protein Bpfe_024127 [Biomphalaria pfeifferi]|uniref:Uncharacterized protein n=1 Tax=Biomphalaria pfeifferi TaxID=112525 RepID=A0AAD8B342_BIOPF|nr:hypothetical protein Bpfe_024127 [Biomphalaria pfeifferi]
MTQLKKSGQKNWKNEERQNANNYSELLEQVIKDIKSASELSVITLFSREPLDENKCGKVTSVQSLYHHTHRVAKEFLYALECWGKMCNKCHTLMSGRTNSTTNITKPKDPNIPASRVQGAQSNDTRQLSKGINGSVINTSIRKKVKPQSHLLNGTTTQGQGHIGEAKKGNLKKNEKKAKKKISLKCITSAKGAKCKNKKTTKETVSVSPPPVAKTTPNSKMDKKKEKKEKRRNKNKDQQTSETKSPAEEKPKKVFKKGQKERKQKTVDQTSRKSKE